MWVTKLLISPVKKRIFCPKTTKFGLKLAFLFIAGSFGALWVGGWWLWRAGCISQDTYLLYWQKLLRASYWQSTPFKQLKYLRYSGFRAGEKFQSMHNFLTENILRGCCYFGFSATSGELQVHCRRNGDQRSQESRNTKTFQYIFSLWVYN